MYLRTIEYSFENGTIAYIFLLEWRNQKYDCKLQEPHRSYSKTADERYFILREWDNHDIAFQSLLYTGK